MPKTNQLGWNINKNGFLYTSEKFKQGIFYRKLGLS